MKTQTIRISTLLPAPAGVVWEKLKRVETLQYIATPYLTFVPVGDTALAWEQGNTSVFRLKLFGLISLGLHTIDIQQFDKDARMIFTEESNRFVPLWNHRIILQEADGGKATEYSDEVVLFAGRKTSLVAIWAKCFYRHRQKRWRSLLE